MPDALAVAAATIWVLLENVKSLVDATDRIALEFEFKDDLVKLREYVVMLQAVLADAESKKRDEGSVQLWLKKLEEVAFDADHVLDKLHYETLRREVESRNQQVKRNKVRSFFRSFFHNYDFRRRMASEISDIVGKLREINLEANDLGLQVMHQTAAAGTTLGQLTDSTVPPNIVGRADDERRIVEMLLTPSKNVLSVIPIVGEAGAGKTTLAKLVYNNPQIDLHFDKKIWICVGRCENDGHLLELILESLRGRRIEKSNGDAIRLEIEKVLERKRYLLVLDNVWSREFEWWDNFLGKNLHGLGLRPHP